MKRLELGAIKHQWDNTLTSSNIRHSGVGLLALRLCLVMAMAVIGFGCGGGVEERTPDRQHADQGPVRGGVLRVLHESAKDLDPPVIDDIYEGTVANQIFEGLVRYDPTLGIAPSLAESWIVEDGGLRYTFHLRDDVHFHDGTPLSAAAVVASLERVLSPDRVGDCIAETYLLQILGAREYRAGRATHITGLRAPDSRTVEVELTEPLSFFLAVLAMDQTRIVPTTLPPGSDGHPIGTGPFVYVGRQTDGDVEELVLERNAEYWGEPAYLDSLVFVSHLGQTPTDEAKISLLLAGQVDVIDVASRHMSRLRTLGYRISATPELTISFVGVQMQTPPLDDVRVRRAIAHCLDRNGFNGAEETEVVPATGIIPPGLPGYLPSPLALSYDPKRAGELLRSAGYGPDHPTATVRLYTSGEGRSYEYLRGRFTETLAEIGIPLEVESMGWNDLDRIVLAGDAPLFLLGWLADVPDADGFLYALFHTNAPNNLFGYSTPFVDDGLEGARKMMPGPDRVLRYRAIEERILSDVAIIPLYHDLTCVALNPEVSGVDLGPYGMPTLRFSRVYRVPVASGVPTFAEDRP